MRLLTAALVAGLTALPAAAQDEHKAERDGVALVHAWARATSGDHADVFLEVENGSGAEVAVTGGAAPGLAEEVRLMGASLSAGAEPVPLEAMPVAAGGTFTLDPGGVFLRLEGLARGLVEGETFEMSVALDPVGAIEVIVEIEDADADAHSHAGHDH